MSRLAAFRIDEDEGAVHSAKESPDNARLLLSLALTEFAKTDANHCTPKVVPCACGQQHRILRSRWLASLREESWVPAADGSLKPPTAESIAALISSAPSLLSVVEGAEAVQLLEAIGISATEIQKALLKDPVTRAHAELVSSNLYRQIGSDPNLASTLAVALKDSESVQNFVAATVSHLKVEANRVTGEIVELFVEQALIDRGLSVTRTGIGSDYDVEFDSVKGGEEQGISLPSGHLIEVKTTQGPSVRLTPAQVKKAAEPQSRDKFWLCVIPRPPGSEPTKELVETQSRFVARPYVFLSPFVPKLNDLKATETVVSGFSEGGVSIMLSGAQARVVVDSAKWAGGLRIDQFVEVIKRAT